MGKKKKSEEVRNREEYIYVIGAGEVMEFSGVDKAAFYAESLKARCGCGVYILRGDRELLKNCLITAARHGEYPKNFNSVLFLEDIYERIGTGKEVLACKSLRSLEQLLPILRAAGLEDIAVEVDMFLRQRK